MSHNTRSHAFALCFLESILLIAPNLRPQQPANPSQIPPNFEKNEEGDSILRQRMDWFYQQRAYPHPRIPAGAWLSAIRELDTKMATERSALNVVPLASPAQA